MSRLQPVGQKKLTNICVVRYKRCGKRFEVAAYRNTVLAWRNGAETDIDEVLHLWTGLGYYARGRNLHKAAQRIVSQHNGHLPEDQQQLESLPGIGPSTAGAIRAIAMQQRGVILDGNVKRVLARCHAIDGHYSVAAVSNVLWGSRCWGRRCGRGGMGWCGKGNV